VRSRRVAQWHVNQPRKQVDTLGQSVCGQQASPRSSARLSRRRCIQRHTKIARSGGDNLVAIQRGLVGCVADAADRGRCKCRRSLNRFGSFWRTVRAGPRIPHERTALPEVQHADEAYAGTAEHAPTGNGRRDPGLRLWGMLDHGQPHGARDRRYRAIPRLTRSFLLAALSATA
jgi:hypothetical protein